MGTANKSITKNTVLLYIRLIITIFIAFFTQRIVLSALGIEDYGIYNVVGGLIVVIGVINAGMIQASQRFFAYEIGRGEQSELVEVFGVALSIHAIISIVILFMAEVFGVWFLNSVMTIPHERIFAANLVFQASVGALFIMVWAVPFDALIISKEDFNIYAYISVIEAILKLFIAYLIYSMSSLDRLIVYGCLLFIVTLISKGGAVSYSKYKYKECQFKFNRDKTRIKKMLSFASFSFIGNIGFILRNQGVNLVINIFFGPAINAARGVAYQVSSQMASFAGNFQMAATPQITKNCANGNIERMQSLIYKSSKYSFCLLFFISLPVLVYPQPLLDLWLGDPPLYSDYFLQLAILVSLIDCMATPLGKGIDATGKIRFFQISICIIMCLDIPFAMLLFKLGASCYSVMFISIITSLLGLFVRLVILSHHISLVTISSYMKAVVFPCILVMCIDYVIAYYLRCLFGKTFIVYLVYFVLVLFLSVCTIYIVCLDKKEKGKIKNMISKSLCHIG
ncbi:polysaccharide biosynthesis protein [Bacteroides clarus]|jgi:O-antigen/teichoic acid export membrane protein|uniref:Polysaccharide biosynthesis protein n=2 Tax=Bacteroidales TaxID=171549 RepID=A0A1Y4JPZ4_9BACE|nr:lipopolysaccharide biosynthesis protein [Bacteroides sp. 44_46]OKY97993.1 MAG: polysaccharide biosynthesis protein [Bacteroides sp. 44_46]OUO01906.1 polysaccharide biosynthesis protein [Bacteroides clarus]OUP32131.1 polysaccharide biosynthesis protein [Bacteroides clarus]